MTLRLLRGRVLIRPETEREGLCFWTPPDNPREIKIHRGCVVQMGPPAKSKKGLEVPPDFSVGDKVLYTWAHNEKGWTHEIDGEKLAVIPQECLHAVISS